MLHSSVVNSPCIKPTPPQETLKQTPDIHRAFTLAVQRVVQKEESTRPAAGGGRADDIGGLYSPSGLDSDLGMLWHEQPCWSEWRHKVQMWLPGGDLCLG